MNHFGEKTVVDHLKEARARGARASSELHGTEMSGHLSAGADAAKDTSFALLLLWMIVHPDPFILVVFAAGWAIWKTARSSLLGWARMERLHRLIEEERWEIEHHRIQEKQELTEMYRAKGFSGKLLEEVIDVLMADDDRLLKVMLEEELGLTLETEEHPLKQASGAAIGVVAVAAPLILCAFYGPTWLLPTVALVAIVTSSAISAKLERNRPLQAAIWNGAVAILAGGSLYFFTSWLK